MTQTLQQYRELRSRVDDKFREIEQLYPKDFTCRLGCHSCCKPALTVNPLERAELREFLQTHSELVDELRALEVSNPHHGKRCSFLRANGACAVYEVRPLVCRSHGAPLQFRLLDSKDENLRARDVCPLNFTAKGITELPATSVINLDTINVLLALLTQRAFPGDESRTPLRIDAILKP